MNCTENFGLPIPPADADHFDTIVVGAGPGGYGLAAELATAGEKVALIEREHLGGTCLNEGCIPTKCMCASADSLRAVRSASQFGILSEGARVDFSGVRRHMYNTIATLTEAIRSMLGPVAVFAGEAILHAGRRVSVGKRMLSAERIVLATGSEAARLDIPGAELAMTSTEVLAMEQLPESMVIIGGGVIGIEFASILTTLGTSVTVVEYCPEILPMLDPDVAKRLRTMLSRQGIKFVTSAIVTGLTPAGEVIYQTRRGPQSVQAQTVLMAVGRRPRLPRGWQEAGINLDRRGFISVDESMQTSAVGIYAVGDVNGRCLLAHAAEAQAAVVAGHHPDLSLVPSAVFSHPEASVAGLTETAAKAAGHEVRVARANFASNGKAIAMGEPEGMVKLTVDADNRIIGMQIVGPHAADLITEGAALIQAGAPVETLAHTLIHAHPTLSETLQRAARQLAAN